MAEPCGCGPTRGRPSLAAAAKSWVNFDAGAETLTRHSNRRERRNNCRGLEERYRTIAVISVAAESSSPAAASAAAAAT